MKQMLRTKHVAFLILSTLLIRNVCLQAEMQHCEILNGVLLRIETPDHPETTTLVDLAANFVEFLPKRWEGEVFPADKIPIETECLGMLDLFCGQ